MLSPKAHRRLIRKRRVRAKVSGTSARPRLAVYRSLTRLTVQIIDDTVGKTLLAASTKEVKSKPNVKGAAKLGEFIAGKAKEKGITTIVFDRAGYAYHGRVKALADAARAGGLKF
ncbi:TPA: 50S ribosomal protein L18 [Candidatus Peribacteria bacterium]|nr:MAG: 50S ribosomal protein L18 [Candidatus Peribacteria bacterium RIFOXYC2_FULL_58_10]OGJ84937.1 MAG: 50S ribosomal protein L18 [Candidatus Peribacteria bacterium RIFOXYD2_FULL_58_15]HAI98990.1 50S ribosomal protein L18 [Candidatus Peribacteria bacterium]HAS34795.1 50S ribosomal protein L18 [Candidatus Peribacteria bacterium]